MLLTKRLPQDKHQLPRVRHISFLLSKIDIVTRLNIIYTFLSLIMNILETYAITELFYIAAVVFLLGMSKGGLPISNIALPILVLIWPGDIEPAKSSVAFILPLLCIMDITAIITYRKHILWGKIIRLFPGTVIGVAVGSILFVSQEKSMITVPDTGIQLLLGIVGLVFVVYQMTKKWILKKLDSTDTPGWAVASSYGFAAGMVSTLAHAAGPVMQMYLLPRKLSKMNFAATRAGYFLFINLVKMVPFILYGRIDSSKLVLGLWMLPAIPLGVATGYFIVKFLKPNHYIGLIYTVLSITSVTLIWKALH